MVRSPMQGAVHRTRWRVEVGNFGATLALQRAARQRPAPYMPHAGGHAAQGALPTRLKIRRHSGVRDDALANGGRKVIDDAPLLGVRR